MPELTIESMTAEVGHFALILAFVAACVQALPPLIGAARKDSVWMSLAAPAAVLQFTLIALAFLALTRAFVTSDFSLAVVAANSHTAKPLLYKLSGVWGNHEGSMLLWVLVLSLFGAAIAVTGRALRPSLHVRVLAVQGLLGAGFLAFILFTSNPFARLFPAPLDGNDLNPLLQDPGLAFHPPLLYLGYVGLSTTFSFAVAALIEGRVDRDWGRWVRPWTLASWLFLTAGITLGSWWAYYELGWGGWWFWDPVENASFMPWLAATALLHSSLVTERRDAMRSWTVLLAIVAFAFSLLGTFLVRSGVLTSVHSFASDPDRGVFILLLLVVSVGGAFVLYAWRGPGLRGTSAFHPVSREGGLVINNFLLTAAAAAVLLGTVYPLIIDVIGAGKISVGAPYFEAVFVPMMVPLVLAMGVGPLLSWQRANLRGVLGRLKPAAGFAVLAGIGAWLAIDQATALAAFGMALAAWLLLATLTELAGRIRLVEAPGEAWRRLRRQPRGSWGMTLAHAGLAIAIAGMTASSAWRSETIQVMTPGERVVVSGYLFTFLGAETVRGPNYSALQGTFEVRHGDGAPLLLQPERRHYDVGGQTTTEAAIRPTFLGDIYAVIGEARGDEGGYVARIYFNPLVPWMWTGVLMMVLGAGLSLSSRRRSAGAPARAAAAQPAAAE